MKRALIGFTCGAVLLMASTSTAMGASTQENFAKYEKLRARLAKDFMVVGEAQGQSQPAHERNDAAGFIKWADSTINLGWYMGILASEVHLETNLAIYPGADNKVANASQKTLEELYFALAAMERLDRVADKAFPEPCGQTESLNGFFLRDDVPDGFHQNFAGLTSTQSDFIDPVLTNKEMSQDQVYHVLLGLALVKHLVPASAVVKGKTLKTWAAEQSKRIGEHFAKGNWQIKNPACGNRNVNRGEQAVGYSAGTKLAFSFISDGTYAPTTPLDLWGTLKSPTNPAYNDPDNLHMSMAIAAVGNGWGTTTANDLATLSAKEDWVLYPILHRVLHGKAAEAFCTTTGTALNKRAREMLDELPSDGEPKNPRPGPPAVHGFTVSNRFIRSKDQHYAGQLNHEGMRYSGTDYMLLHNLYAIATPATWTQGANVSPCATPAGVEPNPSGSDAGAPNGSTPPGGTSPTPSENAPDGATSTDDAASGCGCQIPGTTTSNASLALAGLFFLGFATSRRVGSRRR